MPFISGVSRNQVQMLPEYLEDYVDGENSVRVIDAFVDTFDMRSFTKSNPFGPGGHKYNPKVLLKLYLYGYQNGIRTSRKLEKATYNNIEVIWLMGKLHPDFKTIAEFRKENKEQLKDVFKEFNLLCKDWDLLKKCNENKTITYVTHQTYSNATGNPEYYSDKFKYDSKEDIYVCPLGQKLYRTKQKADEPERVKYKNYRACSQCPNKNLCTKSGKGRVVSRSKDQDFSDIVDARTDQNMDKYLKDK